MAISGIVAVSSLRLAIFINQAAMNVYLSSLTSTVQEVLRPTGLLLVLVAAIAIAFGLQRDRYLWITVITVLAGLFVVGTGLTLLLYAMLGYNEQSGWLILLLGINVLFTSLSGGLPLALLGLFFYDALRPS